MAAEVLATAGVSVTVHEQMPSVGRKLLLAGRGGLNLTHSEPLNDLLDRYGPARPRLEAAIRAFGPDDLRAWCAGLGQPTFVGSSGRVFPEAFRAAPLLRAWLARLDDLGVEIRTRQSWTGWTADGALRFADPVASWRPDVTVLALGGASWPRVGSDGAWVEPVRGAGIDVVTLRPANCGFAVGWSPVFRDRFKGTPLKGVAVSFEGRRVRGDTTITTEGIEGGAVYVLSAALRDRVDATGQAVLTIDLAPDRSASALADRLAHRRPKDSATTALRRAGLTDVGVGLLREATANVLPTGAPALAQLAKSVPVTLVGVRPIARAISTAGGIALDEVDDRWMIRRRPGTFVAGEMLDWEAPTGGYLLQGTFSTAVAAARGALARLDEASAGDRHRGGEPAAPPAGRRP
jgi:uncharacterized flavoprotein (TIGR03862 family)